MRGEHAEAEDEARLAHDLHDIELQARTIRKRFGHMLPD